MQREVSFPWSESSPRTIDAPSAWFEVARYRRLGKRHSVPPPNLRFATARPASTGWEEVPKTREILMLEHGRGGGTQSTSLTCANSALVREMQPGEKVGVLVIAGRGTNVNHVIREVVIYMFCSW
jgi:hypothetical protein